MQVNKLSFVQTMDHEPSLFTNKDKMSIGAKLLTNMEIPTHQKQEDRQKNSLLHDTAGKKIH